MSGGKICVGEFSDSQRLQVFNSCGNGGYPPNPWCPPQCPPQNPWCPPQCPPQNPWCPPNQCQPQCGNWIPFCCSNCDAQGTIFVPKDCPVYLTANNVTSPQQPSTSGNVLFGNVVGQQPQPSYGNSPYNPATGIYTVPQGMGGFYLISANLTLSNGTANAGTATVSININGTPIVANTIPVANGANASFSATVGWFLQPGQSINVSYNSSQPMTPATGTFTIVRQSTM